MEKTSLYDPIELIKAIHRGEIESLKAMIADGADVNALSNDSWSPAMQACGDGQIKCLRILIAAGADLNIHGERGMTPLIVAAMDDEEPCLAALLKAGVDLEKRDDQGNTAASVAAAYGSTGCLVRLFKAAANLDGCVANSVHLSCKDALAAERARREAAVLAKAAAKSKISAKSPRI